jgi:hypothetical protein
MNLTELKPGHYYKWINAYQKSKYLIIFKTKHTVYVINLAMSTPFISFFVMESHSEFKEINN